MPCRYEEHNAGDTDHDLQLELAQLDRNGHRGAMLTRLWTSLRCPLPKVNSIVPQNRQRKNPIGYYDEFNLQ